MDAEKLKSVVDGLFTTNIASKGRATTRNSMARHIYFHHATKVLKMTGKEAAASLGEGFTSDNVDFSAKQYRKLLEGNGWNERFDKMVQQFRNRMLHLENLANAKPTYEELEEQVSVLNKLLDARNEVLGLIPECPQHGFCLPYFKDWIVAAKSRIKVKILP